VASPLVEALKLLLGHLPAEHHLADRLRWLHEAEGEKRLETGRILPPPNNGRGGGR
jgi:hypothetical protein